MKQIKIIDHPMYHEEIEMGDKLIHSGTVFEVKAFRVLPSPIVWGGEQWYCLARCKLFGKEAKPSKKTHSDTEIRCHELRKTLTERKEVGK